jgi:heme exporter protein D
MSFDDFFAMGGYGFYVWGSYAVTVVLVAIEIVAVRTRFRAARMAAQPGDIAR